MEDPPDTRAPVRIVWMDAHFLGHVTFLPIELRRPESPQTAMGGILAAGVPRPNLSKRP